MTIRWMYFPRSSRPPEVVLDVVVSFRAVADEVDSVNFDLPSDQVLARLAPHLQARGFLVETSKKSDGKIRVPVLLGLNGLVEKSFDVDAYDSGREMVVEVEAGRGVVNNQFLKDLFEACMMQTVSFAGIAVRNQYKGSDNFEYVVRILETLYASNRLHLPLKGILVVGY